jgi:hypothetical protein
MEDGVFADRTVGRRFSFWFMIWVSPMRLLESDDIHGDALLVLLAWRCCSQPPCEVEEIFRFKSALLQNKFCVNKELGPTRTR